MKTLNFPYTSLPDPVFGYISLPVIQLRLYSERLGAWVELQNVLASTGADVSVVPMGIGELLVDDVESGFPFQLGQSDSAGGFNAYLHRVQAQLGDKTFEMPLAISTSAPSPPTFGQRGALDQFVVRFVKGQELIIET